MMQRPARRSAVIIFFVIVLLSFLAALHGCSIAVNPELTSITIEPLHTTDVNNSLTIAAQTMQLFKASGHYSDARTVDITSSAEWSTSDASIAALSKTADKVAASAIASSGTCTVSVTYEGVTAAVQLVVKDLPLQSITVSPAQATMHWHDMLQLTATGLFSDGTETITDEDITTEVSWSSSAPAVVSIDDSAHKGLAATIDTVGSAVITAQWQGIASPGAEVLVSGSPLQTITITANGVLQTFCNTGTPIMYPDFFKAYGAYADGTTKDLTNQITWESSSPDILTIDNTGSATARYMGRVTVTATLGDISGTLSSIVIAYPDSCGH
jgi:Bacterial Ig-like domain (group 2)